MTKIEQARHLAWRFKVLQRAGERSRNVARTCRYFGISRQAFYRWKRRQAALGHAGLADRPSTPHRSPRATPADVVSKVLYLRQTYHFGPGRIADYLVRFHQRRLAVSSVHRILVRHGLNRLPANQKHRAHAKRWQRYEKPQPGHRLQLDVKFLERIPGTRKRLYQFTAIDDCTRIRVLKVYDACNQVTAIRFIDEVVRRLPFRIHVVQTDNGAEFQSRFHWHLEGLDIRHAYIRPRTPHLNGKVERSHRIDDQEFYQLLDKDGITDDIHLFNEKLREWEEYYNCHRPHGALDGQTPYERLVAKMRAGASPRSRLGFHSHLLSTHRRNDLCQFNCRRSVCEGHSGSRIQPQGDRIELRLGIAREVGRMRQTGYKAVSVFIGASLPGALRITEVDLDVRSHRKRAMGGKFGPAIPRERFDKPLGQSPNSPRQRADDCLRFLIRQADQQHKSRLPFHQRRHVRPACAFQQIAFPMPGKRAVCDVRGPLTNRDGIDDLALFGTNTSAGSRVAKVALPAEVPAQGALQNTAALNKQTAINRFVRHLHLRIARKRLSKPA